MELEFHKGCLIYFKYAKIKFLIILAHKVHHPEHQMAHGKNSSKQDCWEVLPVDGEQDELDYSLFLIHFLQFGQNDGVGECCSILKIHTVINGQVGDPLLFLHYPFI